MTMTDPIADMLSAELAGLGVDVRGQRPLANGADDIWPFEVSGRACPATSYVFRRRIGKIT